MANTNLSQLQNQMIQNYGLGGPPGVGGSMGAIGQAGQGLFYPPGAWTITTSTGGLGGMGSYMNVAVESLPKEFTEDPFDLDLHTQCKKMFDLFTEGRM